MRNPTTWTITRHDGPNHLGLRCDALPEHQNGPNHLGLCAAIGFVSAAVGATGIGYLLNKYNRQSLIIFPVAGYSALHHRPLICPTRLLISCAADNGRALG